MFLRDSKAVHRQGEWLNRHHSPSALQLPGQRRAGPRDDEDVPRSPFASSIISARRSSSTRRWVDDHDHRFVAVLRS